MNKQTWFEYYDEHESKFRWFFQDYGFDVLWNGLREARGCQDISAMFSFMNEVWFRLPDNKFNIMENPSGWSQFLHLLEELPEQT